MSNNYSLIPASGFTKHIAPAAGDYRRNLAYVSYDVQPPFRILPLLLSHHSPRPITQPATSVLASTTSTHLCASLSLFKFLFSWLNWITSRDTLLSFRKSHFDSSAAINVYPDLHINSGILRLTSVQTLSHTTILHDRLRAFANKMRLPVASGWDTSLGKRDQSKDSGSKSNTVVIVSPIFVKPSPILTIERDNSSRAN